MSRIHFTVAIATLWSWPSIRNYWFLVKHACQRLIRKPRNKYKRTIQHNLTLFLQSLHYPQAKEKTTSSIRPCRSSLLGQLHQDHFQYPSRPRSFPSHWTRCQCNQIHFSAKKWNWTGRSGTDQFWLLQCQRDRRYGVSYVFVSVRLRLWGRDTAKNAVFKFCARQCLWEIVQTQESIPIAYEETSNDEYSSKWTVVLCVSEEESVLQISVTRSRFL